MFKCVGILLVFEPVIKEGLLFLPHDSGYLLAHKPEPHILQQDAVSEFPKQQDPKPQFNPERWAKEQRSLHMLEWPPERCR